MLTDEHIARRWRREEADQIVEVLGLKDPNFHGYPRSWDEPGLQSRTKDAITSLFFSEPREPQREEPGLLKRGPVLLDGAKRELMLFADGFLFSFADLTRFLRTEVGGYLRGSGQRVKEDALDCFLRQYDVDPDGSITLEGFGSMMREMRANREPPPPSDGWGFFSSFWSSTVPKPQPDGVSWRSLDKSIRGALGRTDLPQKLEVAFQLADIEKIETLRSPHYEPFSDPVCTHVTLAVHIKGLEEPLMLTYEDPSHAEAWAAAFGACIGARILSLEATSSGMPSNTEREGDCFKVIEEEGNDVMSELTLSEDDSYPDSDSIDSTYAVLAAPYGTALKKEYSLLSGY